MPKENANAPRRRGINPEIDRRQERGSHDGGATEIGRQLSVPPINVCQNTGARGFLDKGGQGIAEEDNEFRYCQEM